MIGVWIQKKPCSWKKRCTAMLSAVPHARDGAERVRARAQVRDLAQVLERVLLRLNRVGVGIVDPADDLDRSAWISTACPFPWLDASVPVAMTEQPAVSFMISLS